MLEMSYVVLVRVTVSNVAWLCSSLLIRSLTKNERNQSGIEYIHSYLKIFNESETAGLGFLFTSCLP